MTLIYYDEQIKKQDLYELSKRLREIIGNEILFLPKSFDVCLNASTEQLLAAKNTIEAALKLKETE